MTLVHRNEDELDAALEYIEAAPVDGGRLELIVARPDTDERVLQEAAELETDEGLVGDNWHIRGSSQTEDGQAHPGCQITLMNVRVIEVLARDRSRWPLAGDQLYVDLDISAHNLPPGTRLSIGTAQLEVTPVPHTGCGKFVRRFGKEAHLWVNSPTGRSLNLRGINTRVVKSGVVTMGDVVTKV